MYRRVSMLVAILAFSLWPGLITLHLRPDQQDSANQPFPGDLNARLASVYGNQPLYFEPNEGQTDTRVTYLARGRGYAVFLTPGEMVLAV